MRSENLYFLLILAVITWVCICTYLYIPTHACIKIMSSTLKSYTLLYIYCNLKKKCIVAGIFGRRAEEKGIYTYIYFKNFPDYPSDSETYP